MAVKPAEAPHSGQKLFYGWYVLGAAFMILFFNAGARISIGVIFKPMLVDFGWNRGVISLAFFLNMVFYAISLTVLGRLYDRYGPKWVIIISTLFLSVGFILMPFAANTWQFFLYYGVISAIGLGGTSIPLFATITAKWFVRRRGLAVSLALSGNSIGQFALVPLFTYFVLNSGWRISILALGIVILVVNIIMAVMVINGDPDDLGHRPYGTTEDSPDLVLAAKSEASNDFGLKDAARTRSFWFIMVLMLICGSADFLVATHLIPMVTDHGISPTTAGSMLAWFGLVSLLGMLLAGPAADRIGNKIPIAITFLLRILLFIFILKFKTVLAFYLFSLLFGLTFLVTAPIMPMLVSKLYGMTHLGLLCGFITTIHHLAGGFWAWLGGVVFDKTGDYQLIFIVSAVMAFIAFLCSLAISEKKHIK
jgi:MFS family permease